MAEFTIGARCTYRTMGGSNYLGRIVNKCDNFIHVALDSENVGLPEPTQLRAFTLDGQGTGWLAEENLRGTDGGAQLIVHDDIPEYVPNPDASYPPEPTLMFGVWDSSGRPVREGHPEDTSARPGYGIMNLPRRSTGIVHMDKDHHDVQYRLQQAKDRWKLECVDADWEAVKNPLEALVGLKWWYGYLNSDGFGGEIAFTEGFGIDTRRRSFSFSYERDGALLSIGMMSRDEVAGWVSTHSAPITIVSVEDNVMTLRNQQGEEITFALEAKYWKKETENYVPMLSVGDTIVKTNLLRNLAYQRSKRDSTPELALAA